MPSNANLPVWLAGGNGAQTNAWSVRASGIVGV